MGNCFGVTSLSTTTQATSQNSLVYLIMLNRVDLIKKKIANQQINVNTRTCLFVAIICLAINFRGDTLLHYACAKNNFQLVQYLITHHKNLKFSQKNNLGKSFFLDDKYYRYHGQRSCY